MLRPKSIRTVYIGVLVITALWILGALMYTMGICNERNPEKLVNERIQDLEAKLKEYRETVVLRRETMAKDPNLPWIYAVTPTYARPVQKAELTRLSQTFLHVVNFHWIIVEDSKKKTKLVEKLLQKSGHFYTHLNVATPEDYKMKSTDPNWLKPRGVLQRNLALKWLREHNRYKNAVVFFADDDNTYDLRLFREMRHTKKVSVWPVGLVGGLRFERPLVQNGRVTGWYTFWKPNRPFAMDMAGFAMNLKLLLDDDTVYFDLEVPRGYQESSLLSKLITRADLEPKASNCTEILVWHTRTEKPKLKNEIRLQKLGKPVSDLTVEV